MLLCANMKCAIELVFDDESQNKLNDLRKMLDENGMHNEESRYLSQNTQKPELPEGLEYPKRKNICVKKIENKDSYII